MSGRLPAEERPGLGHALDLISAGKAEAVVFAKLDRLARSVSVFNRLMRRSREEGWEIVCLDSEFDTGTAAGRLVAHIFASVGEWELENTVERLQEGRSAKATHGGYVGGRTVPFGYRVEGRQLVEDTDQQVVVAEIVRLRDTGQPWKQVAAALDTRLHESTVKRIYRRATGMRRDREPRRSL